MDAHRKLRYLQALELDVWLPHTTMPGARPGSLVGRRAAPPAASQGTAAVSRSQRRATPGQSRAVAPALSAVQQSLETKNRDKTRVVKSIDPAPAQQQPASRPAQDTVPPALFLLNCPGRLLLVDSSPSTHEQQGLLRNIMFALTAVKPAEYQSIPFDWTSLAASGGKSDEILHGIVDRSTAEGGAGVLLMGSEAKAAFGCNVAPGQRVELSAYGRAVAAVVTYSSAELLQNPALKAQAWSHAQVLLGDAALLT